MFRAAGGGGALTALDGTRSVTLPPTKANECFGTSATGNVNVIKFSYHVIVRGLGFPQSRRGQAARQEPSVRCAPRARPLCASCPTAHACTPS